MRLHLPFSLRKSVLSSLVSMVALSLGSGSACAVTGSEPQNLVFDGATLTWNTNTENKAFTNAAGESASFAPGDNVTFASDATASLGEDISAGQINIANGADVVIELADNGLNFDTLSMLGGSLDAGDSLNIAAGETLAVGSNGSVLKSELVLGNDARLSVDYAGTGSATSLNNSALSLQGGTRLQLSGCGNGDGKTYILLTGVSELKDGKGNTISLSEGSNAISSYFDKSQPGTGFWAGARLELTDDGILQLVRHELEINESEMISTRKTGECNYQCYESVTFSQIEYESAGHGFGGAVSTSYYSSIELKDNGCVEFSENTVSSSYHAGGGAIYGERYSSLMMCGNGGILFCDNSVSSLEGVAQGGAIGGYVDGSVTLKENGEVTFKGNNASSVYDAGGGAIRGSSIMIENNGSIEFINNSAVSTTKAYGGAIYTGTDGVITLSNNGNVEFRENKAIRLSTSSAGVHGGAIYGGRNSTITFDYNGSVVFSGNSSFTYGGAIYGEGTSTISLSHNGSVEFIANSATGYYDSEGGAIYGNSVQISNNESVRFCQNTSERAGAIYGRIIELQSNGNVHFIENISTRGDGAGAIHGTSDIILRDNRNVEFIGNESASTSYHQAFGGAIYGWSYTGSIIIDDNDNVRFSKNVAISDHAEGGAIYGYDISLCNNGNVEFSKNKAVGISNYSDFNAYGGAVCTLGNLAIQNNAYVLFEKNVERDNDDYRLRSIYASGYYGENSAVISAVNDGRVEFRDSVYIKSSVNLNSEYIDSDGKAYKQTGDIIFTGAYAKEHLNELLSNDNIGREATAEEIVNSQTSELGAVNLYGGSLQVVDGAVLKINGGLSVMEGSSGIIKVSNAELDAGYKNIDVGTSGTLELSNGGIVRASNINITNNATFAVVSSPESQLDPLGVASFTLSEAISTDAYLQPCIVDGYLTLEAGSTLIVDGGYVVMSESLLTFHAVSGEDKINLVLTLGTEYGKDAQVQLFSNVGAVRFVRDGQVLNSTETLLANTFFSGAWVNDETTLRFDYVTGAVVVQNLNTVLIPEPTTVTLSLLALTALMPRRRRK